MDQFETPAPNKLIAAMQSLGNKKPFGVNSLYSVVPQHFIGTYLGPEPLDSNLAMIRLQGGTTVRFVPTLAGLSLSAGNVVKLEKSSILPLHVVGKLVGNINLASNQNGNVTIPGAPTNYNHGTTTATTAPVTWTAGADHFGAGLSYQIFVNGSFKQNTAVGAVSATISGLTAGHTYTSYITAIDGAGNASNKSAQISFTTAGTAAPPSGTQVVKTYHPSSLRSYNYDGNNELDSWHNGSCYQGYDQSGSSNQYGLMFFDYLQIQSDLHGKDMIACKVTVTYAHWWSSSGGTATVGDHDYTGIVSKVSTDHTRRKEVYAHASVGGPITVSLGAGVADDFRTGVAKGITIGGADSTSSIYYGYTYGQGPHIPTLSLTYQT